MATHSSILVWKILWREKPGGLQFMGSQSPTRLKQLSTHSGHKTDWKSHIMLTPKQSKTETPPK